MAIYYSILLLIILVIGLIRYKGLNKPFKILTWSVLVVLLCSILSQIFIYRYKNNALVLHIESITGYLFYSLIYYYLFKNKKIKIAIIISMIIVLVFFVINALFLQPFYKIFPTNIYLPTQILFAVFSLLLFNEMLMYPVKINIIKQSVFWYNTAMLFYATIMFFFLGLTNYLGEHHIYDLFILYFWFFIISVFHILLGIALITDKKKYEESYA
ncbi:MAG: hypothetical protein JWQ63_467 [Mucilaginibacter sp.]|nr:hypothetical protein [Mucilaginibacter sp.]